MFAMKPFSGSSRDKIRNALDGNSVLLSDAGVAHSIDVVFKQRDDAGISKLHVAISSFLGAISHIGASCTCGKVRGVHASWVIARMHDMHTIWYLSIVNFIADTVSELLAVLSSRVKAAITFVDLKPDPLPAFLFGSYGNLGPKLIFVHYENLFNCFMICIGSPDKSQGKV